MLEYRIKSNGFALKIKAPVFELNDNSIKYYRKNPSVIEKGVKLITLNGVELKANIVPFNLMKDKNEINMIMK